MVGEWCFDVGGSLSFSDAVGNIHTSNLEVIKYFKDKKDLIVERNRRNQLDAKLKEMIKHFEQAEARRKQPVTQSGTGNAIRRREGQEAKRFSV
jgi:hypothetical protein